MKSNTRNRFATIISFGLWKKAAFFSVLFLVILSSLLPENPAIAAEKVFCRCSESPQMQTMNPRGPHKMSTSFSFTIAGTSPTQSEKDQCVQLCRDKKYDQGEIVFSNKFKSATEQITDYVGDFTGSFVDPAAYLKDWIAKSFYSVINLLLYIILQLLGKLLSVAMILFKWLADVKNLTSVLSNEGVYFGWKTVRDLLNIAFILILLFTAFAIVFQIDKYNKKTNILTLVIMALLINFSFPITRAIIDISNVLMYTIIKNTSGGADALGVVTGYSGINNIVYTYGAPESQSMLYLIAAIVFVFIYMITMLSVSMLLLIRIIALAILIIFSPIAFIPLPGNNYAGEWWKNLFKWCFFGPIMMFMILIAVQIMSFMGKHMIDMQQLAKSQTIDPGLVGNMAFFAIPIVILWIGMGMAQGMGIKGADKITGFANRAVKRVTLVTSAVGAYKGYQTRRQETQKNGWANRLGTWVGSRQDQLRSHIPPIIPFPGKRDARVRYEGDLTKKVKTESERYDMTNMNPSDLRELYENNRLQGGNRFLRLAAMQNLVDKGHSAHLNDDGSSNFQADLEEIGGSFGENSQAFRQLQNKIKIFDPVAAFSHIDDDDAQRQARIREFVNSSQFDSKKLSPNAFTGDNGDEFFQVALEEQAITPKQIEEIRSVSPFHSRQITDSLRRIAARPEFRQHLDRDPANINDAAERQRYDINRNVQLAHLAQTGEFNADFETLLAANTETQRQTFSRLNKDNLKRVNERTVTRWYMPIAQNMNLATYKTALLDIELRSAQRTLNRNILTNPAIRTDPEANALYESVNADPRFNNIR